jgi:soluble lytic murein transglycosylase
MTSPRAVLFAPLIALALARPAHAGTLSALDPLAPGRAALAAGRLDEAKALLGAPGVDAPGLLGRVLEAQGDRAGACALYAKDRSSSRAPAAALRVARCLVEKKDDAGALAAYAEVGAGPLADDPLIVDEIAAFIDAHDLPAGSLSRAVTLPVATFDDDRRAALGHALLVVARRGDAASAAKALDRLLVELGDTAAATTARELPAAKARPPEDLAAALARANALADRHESEQVIATLSAFKLDNSALGCEARLLLGKAWRKLRKYKAAKAQLDVVASQCGDETKKRAAYLAARVAAMSKSPGAAPLLKSFADTWPSDPLTDDILLWLGESLQSAGDDDGAEAAWRKGLDAFPDGDMAHELRFHLAWTRARRGDVEGARALFDEAARKAGARVDVADRAIYWRARLALCPKLDSLEPTTNASQREAALGELVAFASARPASWYGHLARLLALDVAAKSKLPPPSLPSLEGARAAAAAASLAPSAALTKDARFLLASDLVSAGYDDEALLVLGEIDVRSAPPEDRFAVALLMGRAGAPGAGHALLRDAGLALLPGSPQADTALAWSLDWPRAYASAVEAAADENQVPRPLLFGLAREESAFDADVVSWAGAVGLCQLMMPTAADEARDKKLPPPSVDALKDPMLNARLGAAHLGRRLKGMRHPMLAIAAYNAGPGGVAQWKPKGPLDAWVEQIPVDETRNYVKKVTGSWVTYAALDGKISDVTFPLVISR